MNGFEKRREGKKSAILAAACELFNQNGIDAVRITDIARKACVSKVSIYNYFGGKEGLVRQVFCAVKDKELLNFSRIVGSDLSFKEKFEMYYRSKIIVANELHESLLDHKILSSPQMQQFIDTYFETKGKPLLIEFIEQGKREGDIDRELSTESILLYLESFKDLSLIPLEKKHLIDLAKLVFYGLRGK